MSKTMWSCIENKEIETPENILNFLNDIERVCKKHGLSISHEDCHGGFEIESYQQFNIDWLKAAHYNVKPKKVKGAI